MGSVMAMGLADSDFMDLESQISIHLSANHYPPVPQSMVQPCIEAISAIWEEDEDRLITLPEGITWRDQTEAPAYAIAEGHHLDAWLMYDGE